MLRFLLANWWIYVPIILILLFLTARNNQKVKYIKQEKARRELDSGVHSQQISQLKRSSSRLDKITAKVGLRGILTYIFPKK